MTTSTSHQTTAQPTPQERLWAGQFGADYITRNPSTDQLVSEASHRMLRMLALAGGVTSVLELGANVGNNLKGFRGRYPLRPILHAVEINPVAAQVLREWGECRVYEQSLLDFRLPAPVDLTFTAGVLIHVAPEDLSRAYDTLYENSKRFILLSEYHNITPLEIPYRGNARALFKRDFAHELQTQHPDLVLKDYGFYYWKDPQASGDDRTWFLFEKPHR